MLAPLVLSQDEQHTLENWAKRRSTAPDLALRARIVLASAEGHKHSRGLWVPETVTLCDLGVFVDQAAEPVPAHNAHTGRFRRPMCTSGGRVLQQRPVWPVRVVVIDILAQDQPQVPFADDQHPVQALAAGAGDPAFGNRVRTRRPDWRLDDPRADRGKHCVERRSELRIPVPDQELQAITGALESLSRFRACWVTHVPVG